MIKIALYFMQFNFYHLLDSQCIRFFIYIMCEGGQINRRLVVLKSHAINSGNSITHLSR